MYRSMKDGSLNKKRQELIETASHPTLVLNHDKSVHSILSEIDKQTGSSFQGVSSKKLEMDRKLS